MAGSPQVYFTLPSFSLFPEPLPRTLTPPVTEGSLRSPFGIDPWLYNAALRPEVPIIFASTYVVSVFALNAYNKSRANKPWWIARQSWFPAVVVIHNVLLALYSLATFLALFRAAALTIPSPSSGASPAEYADSLCKMHGPRGFGDAATFNSTINIWEVKNSLIKVGYNGNPDPTDVGRLWNEGLAFWGWWFYISKFYEVLDTLIILAKGKRSATLQTYHHSGAMLCMWAGIRYMSPPIWMFVFVNSLIHTLMYTYYTIGALNYKVPSILKRTLTSLQIIQILWGCTYAGAHLFIAYDIPITSAYQVTSVVQNIASSVSSAASAASASVSEVVESPAAASGTLVALAKKLLLRAVGEEGIAERVVNHQGELLNPHIAAKIEQIKEQAAEIFETRWRTDLTKINCIDTSGEAFAIWFNLLYLLPLAFLFFRFFVTAYLLHGKPRTASEAAPKVVESTREAVAKAEQVIEQLGSQVEDEARKVDVENIREQLRKDVQAMKNGTWGRDTRVSDQIQSFERQVSEQVQKITGGNLPDFSSLKQIPSKVKSEFSSNSEAVLPKVESATVDEPEVKKETAPAEPAARPEVEAHAQSSAGTAAQVEPIPKQDENLAATQEVRPGVESKTKEEETGTAQPVAQTLQAGSSESAAPAEPTASTSETSPSTLVVPSESESEIKQDSNIEATKDVRPSPLDGLNGANQQGQSSSGGSGEQHSSSSFNFGFSNDGNNSADGSSNKLEFSTTSISSDFADFVANRAREFEEGVEETVRPGLLGGEEYPRNIGEQLKEEDGQGGDKPDFPIAAE